MMNDTFDNLTFSNLTTNLEERPSNKPETRSQPSEDHKRLTNEVSFDDSLFLNSQEFTILRNPPHGVNDTNSKNGSINDRFIDLPSFSACENAQKSNPCENATKTGNPSDENDSHNLKIVATDSVFAAPSHRIPKGNDIYGTTPNYNHDADISSDFDILEPSPIKIASVSPYILRLSSWGLPESVLEKYHSRGITTMFPWQVECLNNPKVLKQHANLVYSAPTSAGKTLVAEILAIKTVLERCKKVIFILPFVSVVREKMFYFQDIFSGSGVRVEGFMGAYNPPGGFQSVQFAICTIEKANNLINNFLQNGNVSEIGAVIVDEMHLVGESHRGYILELLLTKLRYISLKDSDVDVQIIGMSATLPNLETLAKWLDAELYITNFRPIPLYEQAIIAGAIYDTKFSKLRQVQTLPDLDTDTDNILQLCLETINLDCSVLIFCPTKNWCENLAQQISTAFWRLGNGTSDISRDLRSQLDPDLIGQVLEQLKRCPVGLDTILNKTVSFGVAFHHAGLTLDERDIIEGSFRSGIVRVLVATSTLSSGVNLPARRVIIRTPIFHGKPLDALTYRQMIGRAGRMGKDTSGESILVCQKHEEKIARNLMSQTLSPIESCLEGDGKLKRAILEIIASGVASSIDDVQLFTKCTLLALHTSCDNAIDEALNFLVTNEFVRLQEVRYVATSFGKACLSSSIPPEDGLSLFTELEKARRCFVLETELHLIYLVTPYSACHQWGSLDWMFYLNLWEKLPSSMKKVAELVGVRESYIVSATRGKLQTNTSQSYHKLLVHKRFFVSLALQDLVNEKPLSEVCSKFSCNRGMLQTLQLTASTFAGMVTSFSKQLGWSTVEILISQFQDRLHFGVSRDLLDLMRLPILNGKSARALFDSGLETLVIIANSDIETIEDVLHRVIPFQSGKIRDGETESGLKERHKLKNIWITGREGLTEREAAELILTTAREYLRIEMGLKEAKWDNETNAQDSDRAETRRDSDSPNPSKSRDLNTSENLFSPVDTSDANTKKSNEGVKPYSDSRVDCSDPSKSGLRDRDLNTSENLFGPLDTSDGSLFGSEETPNVRKVSLSLNSSGDFITTSQDESFVSFKTPKKSKKRPRRGLVEESPRKKSRVSDQVEDIEIVDVCSHEELFVSFCDEAKTQDVIALAVACSEAEEKRRTIGLTQPDVRNDKFTWKNRRVDGFGFCWDGRTSYYVDLWKMEKSIDFVEQLLSRGRTTVAMFDAKEHIKAMANCCRLDFGSRIEDPKLADWLLEPEGREKSLQSMVRVYCPYLRQISQLCGSNTANTSPSLDIGCVVDPKRRSSVECLLSWHIAKEIKQKLHKYNLLQVYTTELACLQILARMEVTGIATDKATLTGLVQTLTRKQASLEQKAYLLAGRRFSFSSSRDVAKILGLSNGHRVSTKKQVLEKAESPISDLVLQWRKMGCIVAKTLQPLIRSLDQGRIYGCYVMHTATGRITMHEPNLQNVAKNFDFEGVSISCRDAFKAPTARVLVSADYCQLELRLLAHLSQDETLCKIMKRHGDVFKSVAATWNRIDENQVSADLRQRAKQICYGIIYGMGSKALADHLGTDEAEASGFMDTFKNTYPGVQKYIFRVVEECKKNGFVETITGRRRFLPHISHSNAAVRSQAERQALNTTIQGSAADIVKETMVVLEERCSGMRGHPKLVLHLHDELLYEVADDDLGRFVPVLKTVMEGSVKLSIPFPVKVKAGPSWGQLSLYSL